MIISYLVFGKSDEYYLQALFSILSFLPNIDKSDKIVVLTDTPKKFHLVIDKISIIELDSNTLISWKGKTDYIYRTKIKAVQFLSNKFDQDEILFLDTDTFLYGNLLAIKNAFAKGHNILHLNEGSLSQLNSKTIKRMTKTINNKTMHGILFNPSSKMWNSGVIGVVRKNFNLIELALKLCDSFCELNMPKRLIEQFSLSSALQYNNNISSCDSDIGHYWGNKEGWNEFIIATFMDAFLSNNSLEELMHIVSNTEFETIPVEVYKSNTRRRIRSKLKKIFPDKNERYINCLNKT